MDFQFFPNLNRRSKVIAFLGVLLFTLATTLVFPSPTLSANSSAAKIQYVGADWVQRHANDSNLKILDVRNNPLSYFSGHLPKAVHIADTAFRGPNGTLPVQYWKTDKLAQIFAQAGIANGNQVLVYSDGSDVLGATMVAYLLERSGIKDIAVLDGGFTGYKNAGAPVTKEFPKYTPTPFNLKDNPAIRVSLSEVAQLIGKPGVTFIDPRPPKLFSGEEQLWTRNGHIPGARNIPWPTFTTGNTNTNEGNLHQLKSLDEIKKILAAKNVKPSDNIIVSCSTGREATLQYTVLKHLLGYPKVRIYEGSWTEYSQSNLPIETGPDKVA